MSTLKIRGFKTEPKYEWTAAGEAIRKTSASTTVDTEQKAREMQVIVQNCENASKLLRNYLNANKTTDEARGFMTERLANQFSRSVGMHGNPIKRSKKGRKLGPVTPGPVIPWSMKNASEEELISDLKNPATVKRIQEYVNCCNEVLNNSRGVVQGAKLSFDIGILERFLMKKSGEDGYAEVVKEVLILNDGSGTEGWICLEDDKENSYPQGCRTAMWNTYTSGKDFDVELCFSLASFDAIWRGAKSVPNFKDFFGFMVRAVNIAWLNYCDGLYKKPLSKDMLQLNTGDLYAELMDANITGAAAGAGVEMVATLTNLEARPGTYFTSKKLLNMISGLVGNLQKNSKHVPEANLIRSILPEHVADFAKDLRREPARTLNNMLKEGESAATRSQVLLFGGMTRTLLPPALFSFYKIDPYSYVYVSLACASFEGAKESIGDLAGQVVNGTSAENAVKFVLPIFILQAFTRVMAKISLSVDEKRTALCMDELRKISTSPLDLAAIGRSTAAAAAFYCNATKEKGKNGDRAFEVKSAYTSLGGAFRAHSAIYMYERNPRTVSTMKEMFKWE